MLVESLKRVIEKLKIENDYLKKENAQYSGVGEKVNLEKSLRTKISNLETVIHSYEMKDVNLDEQKKTIKKLIEANKQLRLDLEKEVDRYQLLEKKYSEVLSKFNILGKENARNEEMIFGMTTGTNIRRYQNYMEEDNEWVWVQLDLKLWCWKIKFLKFYVFEFDKVMLVKCPIHWI